MVSSTSGTVHVRVVAVVNPSTSNATFLEASAEPVMRKTLSACTPASASVGTLSAVRANAAVMAPVPPLAMETGRESVAFVGVAQSIPPPVFHLANSPSVGSSMVCALWLDDFLNVRQRRRTSLACCIAMTILS